MSDAVELLGKAQIKNKTHGRSSVPDRLRAGTLPGDDQPRPGTRQYADDRPNELEDLTLHALRPARVGGGALNVTVDGRRGGADHVLPPGTDSRR